jgi:hypothetical protein
MFAVGARIAGVAAARTFARSAANRATVNAIKFTVNTIIGVDA